MPASAAPAHTLRTPEGDVALAEYRLRLAGREWGVLHTDALLSVLDEQRFLGESREQRPYGVALWPSAVALAHEVAARAADDPNAFGGRRVLELGAGTGLPGIVAASFGARVTQTDRHALALEVGRRNGARNGVAGVTYRQADWTAWDDAERYDWILGADVLYAPALHPHLRRIFGANLAADGRVLLGDPFRAPSFTLLEAMAADGWGVAFSKWRVDDVAGEPEGGLPEGWGPRPVGVFELRPPLAPGEAACSGAGV